VKGQRRRVGESDRDFLSISGELIVGDSNLHFDAIDDDAEEFDDGGRGDEFIL
jgi:hypothetical protein